MINIELLPIQIQNFLSHIRKELDEFDIELVMGGYGEIKTNDKTYCNGYFDEDGRELVFWVDQYNMDWVATAVHEYGHFLQFKNKKDMWDRLLVGNQQDEWLAGQYFPQEKADKFGNDCAEIEHDNEKQVIDLVKKFGLEEFVDIETYTQKANAYVIFYQIINKYRRFYPLGGEPHKSTLVYRSMPTTFDYDPRNPPAECVHILDQYYRIVHGFRRESEFLSKMLYLLKKKYISLFAKVFAQICR